MKNFRLLIALPAIVIASCSVKVTPVQKSNGNLPPGQAKKIAGSQSAKPFAPGQNKH